ncbi:MAG: hypothetical protein KME20_17185 [Kaiparowitsia implicata GSE-PSE-MK54-09C]|jgi:hypothetical protein|nr:hypothetical protein [Kaiparowitsia implicata GSE-PSE-MK54-09C]
MTSSQNDPQGSSIQTAFSWSTLFRDFTFLADLIRSFVILGAVSGVVLFCTVINPIPKCMTPHSPIEMLLGMGGVIAFSVLGLPLATATFFGCAIWAIVKFWMCY